MMIYVYVYYVYVNSLVYIDTHIKCNYIYNMYRWHIYN